MSRPRVTLATIDAAAIDALHAPPSTTGVCARPQSAIRRFPSNNTCRNNGKIFDRTPAGFHRRPVNVDRVDLFHLGLSYGDSNRRFADRSEQRLATPPLSSFESATPSIIVFKARITAAAITGPASGPTPTSSTPATAAKPRRRSSCSRTKSACVRHGRPPPGRGDRPDQVKGRAG
jgi:hypothetical protein